MNYLNVIIMVYFTMVVVFHGIRYILVTIVVSKQNKVQHYVLQ